MPKPVLHCEIDVKKWGGSIQDYLPIHNWFDATKAFIADNRHRALRHHSEGIFLAEQLFGEYIMNSDGKKVSVRDIGESHVLTDFGGRFIPTAQDYIEHMEIQPWMYNQGGYPSSHKKIEQQRQHHTRVPSYPDKIRID